MDEVITDASLLELVNQDFNNVEELSSDDDSNAGEKFKGSVIAQGLRLGRELQTYFLNNDPDTERAFKFQRTIKKALSQYEEIYKETSQTKQRLITDFVSPKIINEERNEVSDSEELQRQPKKKKVRAIISSDED